MRYDGQTYIHQKLTKERRERMATQAEKDNAQAATLEENARQFDIQAAEIRQQIQQGEALEFSLTEDAKQIEAKAVQLEADIQNMVASQTVALSQKSQETLTQSFAMVEQKATSVLEKTTKMVNDLREEIILRLDNVRNPLTGALVSFEELFSWMFVFHKENVYTAEEYDNLGLPAALYDSSSVKAYDYDFDNKTYLSKLKGSITPLTAKEYDTLGLSCSKFATYNISAAYYDLFGKALLK